MKKLPGLLFALMGLSLSVNAQNEHMVSISPDIKDAIVYLNGAQLRYQIQANLVAGRNLLLIKNLASDLNPSGIKVAGDSKTTVLSINHKIAETKNAEYSEKYQKVSDSLKLITKKAGLINDEINALQTQKDLLLKNMSLGGQQSGVNVTELQKASDFYQVRILDINKKISEFNTELIPLNQLITELNTRLKTLYPKMLEKKSEISVLILAETAGTANLQLAYLINKAGWMAYYDLECEDISKPINLKYRAKVYNNCGIDWQNINIVLSTADPSLDINAPELKTWYISSYSNITDKNKGKYYSYNEVNNQNQDVQEQNFEQTIQQTIQYQQIEVPEMSYYFNIKNKYSIPSDNKPYIIEIDEFVLNASYDYVSVPPIEKSAYLLATIKDWEQLNLVEGYANIFMNETYVGQSYINPNSISDSLQISFGTDSKIVVERNMLKEYSSKQLIGGKRKATYVYEISVKNTYSTAVKIEIQDQIPVSTNQEIEVSADQVSSAEYNPLTGICKWVYVIEPGKTISMKLGYSIKYPKNLNLQMNKTRSVNNRYF